MTDGDQVIDKLVLYPCQTSLVLPADSKGMKGLDGLGGNRWENERAVHSSEVTRFELMASEKNFKEIQLEVYM